MFVNANGSCRCTFTVCQCSAQMQIGYIQGFTIITSNYVPEPLLPTKNQPHYSQFNRGAYGSKRKKR